MTDTLTDTVRSKTIFIASDHNGLAAKNYIIKLLKDYTTVNLGPSETDGKVDYIDYAVTLCQSVLKDEKYRGILVCGTGTGMSIAANRFKGIRAAIATDRATASLSREHNNSNVLVLGQWRNSLGSMDEIVKSWLETPFEGGRHVARLKKLETL